MFDINSVKLLYLVAKNGSKPKACLLTCYF